MDYWDRLFARLKGKPLPSKRRLSRPEMRPVVQAKPGYALRVFRWFERHIYRVRFEMKSKLLFALRKREYRDDIRRRRVLWRRNEIEHEQRTGMPRTQRLVSSDVLASELKKLSKSML